MLVNFDSLNRFEIPNFTLCNPGSVYSNGVISNVVGMLTDTSDEELVLNFGAISELNFRIYQIDMRHASDLYAQHIYNSVKNRRLIFVENMGYFTISSVKESYSDGGKYKDVTAQSIEAEIQNKMIPYIENGTYKFIRDDGDTDGIMDIIMRNLPGWTVVGYAPEVAERYRTFEDVDPTMNCYGFMMNNLQEAFECIFSFDIINRTIQVYDKNSHIDMTTITLSRDDLEVAVDVSENADDLYTAISVRGSDDVTISAVNPTGSSIIYDFSYYMPWMSTQLRTKLTRWNNMIDQMQVQYTQLSRSYYAAIDHAYNASADINNLKLRKTLYQRCRDNIVADDGTDLVDSYNAEIEAIGGDPISISGEIDDILAGIDALIAECDSSISDKEEELSLAETQANTARDGMRSISNSLAMDEFFEQEEYAELQNYIFEGSYTDDYIVITDMMTYPKRLEQIGELYKRAKAQLKKISAPTREFSIDVENFLFSKSFEHFSNQIRTGCIITAEIADGVMEEIFLTNITVNYADNSLSMTFGNTLNRFDPKALFDNVLGSVSKSTNSINYLKDAVQPIKDGELNEFKLAIQRSRDLTMSSALASNNEEVVIDGSGYTGRRRLPTGEIDPEQIKITGKSIVFTDDGWESARTAIGKINLEDGNTVYGVNAETIIGDMIIGSSMKIIDENGEELLSIVDGQIQTSVSRLSDDLEAGYKDYVSTTIQQTEQDILASVVSQMISSDEWKTLEENITSIRVTAEGLETTIGGSITDLEGFVTQFNTFFKMAVDGLTIGKQGSEFETRIDEAKLSFIQSGTEVAYIQYNRLYIGESWITNGLYLGPSEESKHSWEHIDRNGVWCLQILGG